MLDALTYAGRRESLAGVEDSIRLVVGDITDAELVSRLVAESDAVVHFAAESHVDNALAGPEPFLHTNVVGTFTILEAVRRHGVRLHHISTDEVYGDLELDDEPVHRVDALQPVQPVLGHQGGRRHAGARLGALVRGARDNLQLLQQLRPVSARREVHPAPDHQRAHRPPPQAVRHRRQRARLDPRRRPQQRGAPHPESGEIGRTYLISSEGERDNLTVLRTLLQMMGRDPDDFDHVTDRVGHDLRYAIDPSTLYDELCWAPKHTDFEEGLRETIDWYRANESWWRPLKDASEARYEERGQ